RADEGEVDDDRLAHHLVEGDLRRGDPILEDVQGRVDVGARVQALPHARDLPEAGAASVGRDLEPQVGGRRAERPIVHGHGEVDVARHGRGSSWRPSRSTRARAQAMRSGAMTSLSANGAPNGRVASMPSLAVTPRSSALGSTFSKIRIGKRCRRSYSRTRAITS